MSELRGPAIDLRMLSYEFVILEESGTACEFALDDIYWEGGAVTGVEPPRIVPQAGLTMSSMPNPFRTSTELRFELPAAAPYEVEVFDPAGKRVTTFRGSGKAGVNAVRWDGRDAQGHASNPGIYYYRLVSKAQGSARKVVLLR